MFHKMFKFGAKRVEFQCGFATTNSANFKSAILASEEHLINIKSNQHSTWQQSWGRGIARWPPSSKAGCGGTNQQELA
jgi:hypothetical protein